VLPLDSFLVPSAPKPKDDAASTDKKTRRGMHPGRGALPAHLPRVPVFNRVPDELRTCRQCGSMMTTVSHASCFILNVIPARVFVEERLDETIACRNDDTIVSASPPPQIVERGKLGCDVERVVACGKSRFGRRGWGGGRSGLAATRALSCALVALGHDVPAATASHSKACASSPGCSPSSVSPLPRGTMPKSDAKRPGSRTASRDATVIWRLLESQRA
jgi:hypothetical protein